MKRFKLCLPLIILAGLSIFFISCNKGDDIQYSCDPIIDEFAKKYKNDFSEITRKQLVQLPSSYQKAVFLTLSPERRTNLWKEKLQIVMEQNENPSLQYKIQDLYNHISIEDYNRLPTEPPRESTLNFIDEWESEVLGTQLIDSVNFIVNFCTLMTSEELDRLVYHPELIDLSWFEGSNEIPPMDVPPNDPDCECRYDIYCSIFLNDDCESGGCEQVYNCGVLGGSACKGLCNESQINPD